MGFTTDDVIKDKLGIEYDRCVEEINETPFSAIARVAGHMQLDDGRHAEVTVSIELDPEEWTDEDFADSQGLI